jgi:hypothetical protein
VRGSQVRGLEVDTPYIDRRPSSAGPTPAGRVTLNLYGPIGELATALRTLADALDREQARSAVTYTATVEADGPGPAPGGMTPDLADRFVAQLSSAAVDVLALLCHNAPQLTYEDLQAQAQANSASAVPRSAGYSPRLPRAASGCPERWTTRSSATRAIDATGSSPSLPSCCCPLLIAFAAPHRREDGARAMRSPAVRSDVCRGW